MDNRLAIQIYFIIKMYTLTEDDIKFLDSISCQLQTAKQNYARNIGTRAAERLKDLYKKMYGQDYVGSSSCSTCQLRLLQLVGNWLDKHKEVHDEPEPMLITNELEVQATNKDKKKTGRKKK